ncbi:MAG: phage major capsid protein [Vicinamibacterales bacterium]
MRFTLLPFLLALVVAIGHMPTDVYQICAWNHGTEKVEPWRSTSRTPTLARTRAFMSRATAWCAGLVSVPLLASEAGEAAMDLLVPGASRIAAFRKRATAIQSQIDAIGTALEARGDTGVLTEAERTQLAALKAAKADTQTMLAEAEEAERTAPAVPDPDAATGASASSVVLGKDRSQDDPKRGFRDHKEYLKAVMAAGRNPHRIDHRLKPLQAAQGSDEQGVYSDPHGGFLVPHGIAPGILSVAPESDPVAGLCTPVEMTAPTVSFNARVDKDHSTSVSGGFVVTRRPETVDGTISRGKFEQVTLTANEEFGLAVASERILTDSPTSFIAIIQAGFRDEYIANGMKERIDGSGVGERQGALKSGCKITVGKETGQTAGTIVKENIDKMAARCWRYSRAIYLANHNTRPQLTSIVQAVGVGGSAVPYFTTVGAPAGFDALLDGRPLLFTEFAKTLGTEGDLILIIPTEYLEGTYQSEQYAESMHVRFAAADRMFRFYRRNDGQWWWRSPLTPKNGDTLSPVVTLQGRS